MNTRWRLLRWYGGSLTADVVADDFDFAAAIQRAARATGHTVRSATDPLIAAAAIRTGCTVVPGDIDVDQRAGAVPELSVQRLSR